MFPPCDVTDFEAIKGTLFKKGEIDLTSVLHCKQGAATGGLNADGVDPTCEFTLESGGRVFNFRAVTAEVASGMAN